MDNRKYTLGPLVKAGILIPGPGRLSCAVGGMDHAADLGPLGEIVFEGTAYKSPSAFSVAVKRLGNPSRKADDGWTSVRYMGDPLTHYRPHLERLGGAPEGRSGLTGGATASPRRSGTATAAKAKRKSALQLAAQDADSDAPEYDEDEVAQRSGPAPHRSRRTRPQQRYDKYDADFIQDDLDADVDYLGATRASKRPRRGQAQHSSMPASPVRSNPYGLQPPSPLGTESAPAVIHRTNYVQCENPACLKWRKVTPQDVREAGNVRWLCTLNPDPRFNSCDVPQEMSNEQIDGEPPGEPTGEQGQGDAATSQHSDHSVTEASDGLELLAQAAFQKAEEDATTPLKALPAGANPGASRNQWTAPTPGRLKREEAGAQTEPTSPLKPLPHVFQAEMALQLRQPNAGRHEHDQAAAAPGAVASQPTHPSPALRHRVAELTAQRLPAGTMLLVQDTQKPERCWPALVAGTADLPQSIACGGSTPQGAPPGFPGSLGSRSPAEHIPVLLMGSQVFGWARISESRLFSQAAADAALCTLGPETPRLDAPQGLVTVEQAWAEREADMACARALKLAWQYNHSGDTHLLLARGMCQAAAAQLVGAALAGVEARLPAQGALLSSSFTYWRTWHRAVELAESADALIPQVLALAHNVVPAALLSGSRDALLQSVTSLLEKPAYSAAQDATSAQSSPFSSPSLGQVDAAVTALSLAIDWPRLSASFFPGQASITLDAECPSSTHSAAATPGARNGVSAGSPSRAPGPQRGSHKGAQPQASTTMPKENTTSTEEEGPPALEGAGPRPTSEGAQRHALTRADSVKSGQEAPQGALHPHQDEPPLRTAGQTFTEAHRAVPEGENSPPGLAERGQAGRPQGPPRVSSFGGFKPRRPFGQGDRSRLSAGNHDQGPAQQGEVFASPMPLKAQPGTPLPFQLPPQGLFLPHVGLATPPGVIPPSIPSTLPAPPLGMAPSSSFQPYIPEGQLHVKADPSALFSGMQAQGGLRDFHPQGRLVDGHVDIAAVRPAKAMQGQS